MQDFTRRLINSSAIVIFFIVLITFLWGKDIFVLDVITHFTIQFTIILIILSIAGIFVNKQKLPRILYAMAILIMIYILSLYDYTPLSMEEAKNFSPDIYYQNIEYFISSETALADIKEVNAPIVAIVEMTEETPEALAESYPGTAIYNNRQSLSCGIFAKEEAVFGEVLDLTYPVCFAEFDEFSLYVIHPTPPLSKEFWDKQNLYFDEITELIAKEDGNWIIVGDFNAAPLSPQFRSYFSDYITHMSLTWEYGKPEVLPIDHALSNFDLDVEVLRHSESDHNALLIKMQ